MSGSVRAFIFYGLCFASYCAAIGGIVSQKWMGVLVGGGAVLAALTIVAILLVGKAWVDDGE